jgi:hypothetical protein
VLEANERVLRMQQQLNKAHENEAKIIQDAKLLTMQAEENTRNLEGMTRFFSPRFPFLVSDHNERFLNSSFHYHQYN